MKPRRSNQRNRALTLIEVLVVILTLFVLVVIILPQFAAAKRHMGPTCLSNIQLIGHSFQTWAGDNNGKFPTEVSVAKGGAMEPAATGNAVAIFQVMSNELGTPKFLLCQKDKSKTFATNFDSDFTAKNISYFVGLDANTNFPQAFLSGDDNFAIGGEPVKSGLLQVWTNAPVTWTATRHIHKGNIGLADGSVQQTTSSNLNQWFQQTGLVTNRLAIP